MRSADDAADPECGADPREIATVGPVRKFLETLAETGEVPVPAMASAAAFESVDVDDLLLAADAAARLDAPGDAPPLDAASARWAARMLFRACCCLADRSVDAATVAAALGEPCPVPMSASVRWSVDLLLRHLPSLHGLARGLAPGDPLVASLERIGAAWPLSAVGMTASADGSEPRGWIENDPCLRRIYVDRVIRHGVTAHAAVPWVAEGVRSALGAHADLAPAMARALGSSRETSDAR